MIKVGDHWTETTDKPETCPSCGSKPIADILWGYHMLTPELHKKMDQGLVHFGGPNFTEDDPLWLCKTCGLELYPKGKEHFQTVSGDVEEG